MHRPTPTPEQRQLILVQATLTKLIEECSGLILTMKAWSAGILFEYSFSYFISSTWIHGRPFR